MIRNCTTCGWEFYESFHRASRNIVGNLSETLTGWPDLSAVWDRSTSCKHVSFFLYGCNQWRVYGRESNTPRRSIEWWYFPYIPRGNGSTHFVLCILQVNRIMAPLLFIGYIIIVFFLMLNMWVLHAHLDRSTWLCHHRLLPRISMRVTCLFRHKQRLRGDDLSCRLLIKHVVVGY